ncbi:MAG: hypothetical protein QGF59_05355 [Pirellulaceae bacterium]|nr:hypothetical protein [Pirellulaceae bacterium]
MKKWFSLVMVVALASISTPLEAGIFDRLEEDTVVVDTSQESIPLTDGGGEAVDPPPETVVPAPTMDLGDAGYGAMTLGYGYPFKTGCCTTHNARAVGLWRGFCSRAHRGCGKGGCGKGGCSTGKCGHGGIVYGKGFGHVQQSHVQRSHVQRSHVKLGHVQHGKRFSDCHTCGMSPCGCRARGHHQKSFRFGYLGKSCGTHGCGKGHATGGCGCGTGLHGNGMKLHLGFGRFDRQHHCGTCGKSKGIGFGKRGCDCGSTEMVKGWSQKGSVIWDQSQSMGVPHGQPTPFYAPPVEVEVPAPANSLPVPPTPTGHSASIRRLPPVGGYQF